MLFLFLSKDHRGGELWEGKDPYFSILADPKLHLNFVIFKIITYLLGPTHETRCHVPTDKCRDVGRYENLGGEL